MKIFYIFRLKLYIFLCTVESHMMDTCTIEEDSVDVVMMKKLPSKLGEGWISVSIYSLDILLFLSFFVSLCLAWLPDAQTQQ